MENKFFIEQDKGGEVNNKIKKWINGVPIHKSAEPAKRKKDSIITILKIKRTMMDIAAKKQKRYGDVIMGNLLIVKNI